MPPRTHDSSRYVELVPLENGLGPMHGRVIGRREMNCEYPLTVNAKEAVVLNESGQQ